MAKIYGMLEHAQIENVSSLPTAGVKGRYVFLTTDSRFYYDDGSNFVKVVSPATTDTLTNKTLSGNTAATLISGAGTLTLNTSGSATIPNATDTLVGKATTDTLTNKTFDADGTGNSITNIENADIKAAAAIARSKIAAGTADHVIINDGAGAFSSEAQLNRTRGGTGISSTATFPSSGVVVTEAATETLTNKTLTGNIAVNLVSGAATVTLPTTTGTLATLANAETLTNKTLTGNIAVTLVSGAATVTLPTTTSTLSTLALSETLTNKTLTAPSLTTPTIDVIHATDQGSTPSTPSSGTTKLYSKTDGKVYKLTSAGVEQELGAGASGGSINYISANPDAETATTGWATYKDAAGATPVDGTAGSPTLTFTRSTSSPLRGSGSFLVTTTAANLQGEGASYAFTLSSADQAKVMAISFDYSIASGTYADGDLTVYIYDVTNSTLIQPAGFSILGLSGAGKQIATFQTSSSGTSYRLIFHRAVTTSSAMTMKIDNVQLGPQIVQYGAPITDPGAVAWTPTGAWSTNTTYTGQWWRVGKMMRGWVKIAVAGAPTSATLTVNLPSGYTIDTAAGDADTDNYVLGNVSILDSGTNTFPGRVRYSSTSALEIDYITSADVFAAVTQAAPMTFASGDEVHLEFEVPISGWSSTVQMSNDTDTRVVVLNANAATATVTGTQSDVSWTIVDNTHGAFGTTTFTVPVPGFYRVSSNTRVDGTYAANQAASLQIYLNGVAKIKGQDRQGGATSAAWPRVDGILKCVAGDLIKVQVDSGATTPTLNADAASSRFSIQLISGPSAIAASESVNFRRTNTAGTSITNSGSDIAVPFATAGYDSHNAFATDTFTVPVAGKYVVKASLAFANSAYAAGNQVYASIYKNGSLYSYGPVWTADATVTTFAPASIFDDVSCVAGDAIVIRVANTRTAGATLLSASAGNCYMSIFRIGN